MARVGTKRVSEVVDCERDIKPYKLALLVSGVSSGENFGLKIF